MLAQQRKYILAYVYLLVCEMIVGTSLKGNETSFNSFGLDNETMTRTCTASIVSAFFT